MSCDCGSTRQRRLKISSFTITFSSVYAWNARYKTCISRSFWRSSGLFVSPISVSSFSSVMPYWKNSDSIDLISLIKPALSRCPPNRCRFPRTPDETRRRTIDFPISSSTARFSIASSSNTRYARRSKLTISIFITPWFGCSITISFCVCIVNCSGTRAKKRSSGSSID